MEYNKLYKQNKQILDVGERWHQCIVAIAACRILRVHFHPCVLLTPDTIAAGVLFKEMKVITYAPLMEYVSALILKYTVLRCLRSHLYNFKWSQEQKTSLQGMYLMLLVLTSWNLDCPHEVWLASMIEELSF